MSKDEGLKKINLTVKIKEILSTMKEKEEIVLKRRCGLEGQKPQTLQAVGADLSLTRERIRQIEKRAFEKIRERRLIEQELPSLYSFLIRLFKQYGGLVDEQLIIQKTAQKIEQNEEPLFSSNIKFILRASGFSKLKKSLLLKPAWTNLRIIDQELCEEAVLKFKEILEKEGKPMPLDLLITCFKETDFYKKQKDNLSDNFLRGIVYSASLLMQVEDTNDWGLVSWPTINPKTIREWTYYVIKKYGQPIHFTKVGELIKKYSSYKDFNLKTVHNVLISDKRFVLVGNGIYALKEWGYEPGTVFDVMVKIFKKVGRPLTTTEITKLVLKERQVKPNTVLVNLQNKKAFKRIKRATYILIPSKNNL